MLHRAATSSLKSICALVDTEPDRYLVSKDGLTALIQVACTGTEIKGIVDVLPE